MTKEKFVKIMNRLRAANDLQEQVDKLYRESRDNIDNDFLNAAGLQINHESTVIELLEEIFHDDNDIEYFVYELDYGRKYKPGCVTDDKGTIYDYSSAESLYDVLISNSAEAAAANKY